MIATSYGAALDLPASPNIHSVPPPFVPIALGACRDCEGFYWAEPDQDVAVSMLQSAVHAECCRLSHDCEPKPSSATAQVEARLRQR